MTGKPYLIGEVGSCHERRLNVALAMVRFAGDMEYSLGDAVKFQYWSDSEKVAEKRHAPGNATLYERYRLPADWLPDLATEAKNFGSDFLCTVYLPDDIATVAPYVSAFKIASLDALDRPFLNAHLPYDKPIYLSVGLLTEEELTPLLTLRESLGRDHLKLLYCVSAYPCPVEDVQLSMITRYDLDGFSDHTGNTVMGALAYMAGARIIEAHIRRTHTPKDNPDYPHSLEPEAWNQYVENVHVAERASGNAVTKQTQPSEAENRRYMA